MSLSGANDRKQYLEDNGLPRPAKRVRVAVACTRCKSRKQKCDGQQPKCGNCKSVPVCEYIVPTKTIPHGKYQYIKALEARVTELTSTVAAAGLVDSGRETWENVTSINSMHDQRRHDSLSPGSKKHEEANIMEATQYLKDLSLHAGGAFVGDESSNITVGQMFVSAAQTDFSTSGEDFSRPGHRPRARSVSEPRNQSNPLANLPSELAETLLNGFLKHISTRWLALYRPHVICLHHKNMNATLVDPFEVSDLNLVYATGGRFLETIGESGSFYPERFYEAALQHFDYVLNNQDIKSAQTLLMHAVYCLRDPRGLGAWTNAGLAIRICISLGLHRKIPSPKATLAMEIRKRVFWSCYCLDRQISIMLGRPFAISDRDIDAELPLDVSDALSDAAIQAISNPDPNQQANPSTSLSCFIHITRLRRIESDIQQSLYRVDKSKSLPRAKIDQFLSALSNWRQRVPADFADNDTTTYSYDGIYYYEIYHYQCLRFLLYPLLSKPNVDSDLIIKCADACGGVCRTYKNLHRGTNVGFSLMAIYSIFLSGLNLLYCMWLSPTLTYNIKSTNDLNACSVVLYVIAERWQSAKRYRDAFETIKQNVLGLLEGGNTGERVAIQNLGNQGGVNELKSEGLHPEGQREYSDMINDMMSGGSKSQPHQTTGVNSMPPQRMSQSKIHTQPEPEIQPQPNPPPQYSYSIQQQYSPPPPLQTRQPSQQNQYFSTQTYSHPGQTFGDPKQTYDDSVPLGFEGDLRKDMNSNTNFYSFLNTGSSGGGSMGHNANFALPAVTLGLPDDFDLPQFLPSGGEVRDGSGGSDFGQSRL